MAIWIRVIAGIIAICLQLLVLDAAVRTFLLPRVASVRLTRYTARAVGVVFRRLASPKRTYPVRDRVMSLYASFVLLMFQAMWLSLSAVAFAFAFVAAGVPSYAGAFKLSGSSLFTLGFATGQGGAQVALSFLEAGVGLTLLALLIAFIPIIYSVFQRREVAVSRLSVRAGIPATPWGVLEIAQSVDSQDRLEELWREWELWFTEVGETHTTLTIVNFYRSPTPEQTWIGCAASVLDAAALYNSAVDRPASASAGLCIRAGWLSFRRLADYFRIPYPTVLDRSIPISITRDEFDKVLTRLEEGGIPLLPDRDAAWGDFVGWRVNYDAIIEAFYDLFTCPRIDWDVAPSQPLVEPSNLRGDKVKVHHAFTPRE